MNYPEFEYENTRRVGYYLGEGEGTAYFLPICQICGRYVKMDKTIMWSESKGFKDKPNATCKKCGRIMLPCEIII